MQGIIGPESEKEKIIASIEYGENLLSDMMNLLYEIKSYTEIKRNTKAKLRKLENDYQARKYNYFQFNEKALFILDGKSESEVISAYEQQISAFALELSNLNSRFFYALYNNRAPAFMAELLRTAPEKNFRENASVNAAEEIAEAQPAREKTEIKEHQESPAAKVDLGPLKPEKRPKAAPVPGEGMKESAKSRILGILMAPFAIIAASFRALFSESEEKEKKFEFSSKNEVKRIRVKQVEVESGRGRKEADAKKISQPIFSRFFKIHFFKRIEEQMDADRSFLNDENALPISVELIKGSKPEEIKRNRLLQESERIKRIIARERAYSSYSPSNFAAFANISVRKISSRLLETFPDFFKSIYNSLRSSNIKVLSSTYVNIMVLFSALSFFVFSILPIPVFLALGNSVILSVLKSLGVGIFAFAVCAVGFYQYPKIEIGRRQKSINANLPFALNHMAAISASGTPPLMIFRLIANSYEYGEISIEFRRIVDYVEVFGFDPVTATKNVASTTPSKELKELLESLTSTIQSGSEIKSLLREKSAESLNTYRLDLQDYNETIATYSDIYTGVLIAAPLFFVITLALVSILGGNVGNMSVVTMMTIGTYLVIPALNIIFIMFLQLTQPNI
jgi:pilus assembly protein TadC